MAAKKKPVLPVTGNVEADQLLVDDPLVRIIGMCCSTSTCNNEEVRDSA